MFSFLLLDYSLFLFFKLHCSVRSVRLKECPCVSGAVHPGSCPTVTDFVCNNGDCIEYHLECDGKADCSDESDESDELDCSKYIKYSTLKFLSIY